MLRHAPTGSVILQPHRGHQLRSGSSQGRRQLQPCRVTNTSEEIYRALGRSVPDEETDEYIDVSQLQVHNPELGILENRVGKFFLQELFEDSGVDLEETAYWFHTPPGGWNTDPLKVLAAEEAPVTFSNPEHHNEEGDRVLIEELEEGMIIDGFVSDCWLYHGLQVDFGAHFDGLVPIPEDTWMEPGMREGLMPGQYIQARIHRVLQPGLYRWPVQLELLEPAHLAARFPSPDTYISPIDHGWCAEQNWTMQDICQATGRVWEPAQYMLDPEQANEAAVMEQAYGYDDPESPYQWASANEGREEALHEGGKIAAEHFL